YIGIDALTGNSSVDRVTVLFFVALVLWRNSRPVTESRAELALRGKARADAERHRNIRDDFNSIAGQRADLLTTILNLFPFIRILICAQFGKRLVGLLRTHCL